jgi:4-amino-4-deoxy-L-arabinose transferase-like glycosyltransferase
LKSLFAGRQGVIALTLALLAIAVRLWNVLHYPPDWGFDSAANWRYIYRMAHDWALPNPSAGWSTADPPLFFATAAALMDASNFAILLVPLFNTAIGLGLVALAVQLVRELDPERPQRALLAGGLLLFLPAHIYMSAMVSEEMLVAFFTSLCVFLLARRAASRAVAPDEGDGLRSAAVVGVAAGLALLSKLTGALAASTAVAAYALEGFRLRAWRPAFARILVVALLTMLVGGWYFARNRAIYGYFQPFGLPAHQVMFEMPPGERALLDYVRIPLATWTDPQLLHPDLLRSVWGSTFATTWFDGHRFFLPRDSASVRILGGTTLLLALLPTLAFGVGLVGGVRRASATPGSSDAPLLLLVALTLAGYTVYTWQNPWFAVVKGTSLLGLSLPFAYYASDALEQWTRSGRRSAPFAWMIMTGLAVTVIFSGTFNLAFDKTEVSGLQWQEPKER